MTGLEIALFHSHLADAHPVEGGLGSCFSLRFVSLLVLGLGFAAGCFVLAPLVHYGDPSLSIAHVGLG